MSKNFMWHRKERCDVIEVDINLSDIPEIKKKELEGYTVRDGLVMKK
jgi:hypothetical protein